MFVSSIDRNQHPNTSLCSFHQRHQQGGSQLWAQGPGIQGSRCQVGSWEPSADAASGSSPSTGDSNSAPRLAAAARSSPAVVSAPAALYAAARCLRQDAGPQRSNRDRQYLCGRWFLLQLCQKLLGKMVK